MKTIGNPRFEIDIEINDVPLTLRWNGVTMFLVQHTDVIVLGNNIHAAIEALEQLTAELKARK